MKSIKLLNLEQHVLTKADEYTQIIYLKFLLSIASIDGNIEFYDSMIKSIESMIDNMNIEIEVEKICKGAIVINQDDLKEFAYSICNSKLEENFILDSLIFSITLDGFSNKVLEYIISLSEILNLSRIQIKQLTKLAKIILKQDKYEFKNMCHDILDIKVSNFKMYTKEFTDLCVINDFNDYEEIRCDYENIVFANINLDGDNIDNFIRNTKKLHMINCRFSKSSSEYTIFNCDEVTIKNCIFDGFNNTVFNIYECNKVKIINSVFSNCIQNIDEGYVYNSATLLLEDINNIRINNCKFENCYAIPEQDLSILGIDGSLPGSAAIARTKNVECFKLENNIFKNCLTNEERNGIGYLFILEDTECRKATGCRTENCCEIGDKRLGIW